MELIDARKDSFYCVAYSYTRNREDALDVVSESVCKAYTHLHRLEDVDAFYPQCPTRRYLCGGNGKNHVLLEYISETAAEPEPVADIIALLNSSTDIQPVQAFLEEHFTAADEEVRERF